MKGKRKGNWEGEVLSRWQMAKLYREAADKREEIRILHQITLLPCKEVRKILGEEGCALPPEEIADTRDFSRPICPDRPETAACRAAK